MSWPSDLEITLNQKGMGSSLCPMFFFNGPHYACKFAPSQLSAVSFEHSNGDSWDGTSRSTGSRQPVCEPAYAACQQHWTLVASESHALVAFLIAASVSVLSHYLLLPWPLSHFVFWPQSVALMLLPYFERDFWCQSHFNLLNTPSRTIISFLTW